MQKEENQKENNNNKIIVTTHLRVFFLTLSCCVVAFYVNDSLFAIYAALDATDYTFENTMNFNEQNLVFFTA